MNVKFRVKNLNPKKSLPFICGCMFFRLKLETFYTLESDIKEIKRDSLRLNT